MRKKINEKWGYIWNWMNTSSAQALQKLWIKRTWHGDTYSISLTQWNVCMLSLGGGGFEGKTPKLKIFIIIVF